jgi:hypothetical protein
VSDHTQSLLPLPLPSEDKRPLPEIVADGNLDPETGWPAFPLAYHNVGGKRYYAIQDWILGVARLETSTEASKFWHDIKRRFRKAEIETSVFCRTLNYRASDGKNYKRDHTDAEGLYRITQRMGVNTGLSERILNFLAASGAFVDGQRIDAIRQSQQIEEPVADDPEKAIEAAINAYKRMGKTDKWIAVRIQSTVQRKRFTEALQRSMREKPQQVHFQRITDAMRIALWKRDTPQLRAEMDLGSRVNLRDHLTETGLIYEMLAENVSEIDLRQQSNLAYGQAEQIVRADSELIGKHAKAVSEHLGIDIPTGRPLLAAKTKK